MFTSKKYQFSPIPYSKEKKDTFIKFISSKEYTSLELNSIQVQTSLKPFSNKE
jgi:hypothetical protein